MARQRIIDPVVIQTRISGDRVASRMTQPGAGEIVKDNARLRSLTHRKADFMQPLARVPVIVREQWKRDGREDLLRGDRKAMERYLNSSEGSAFRTRPKGRSRAFSYGGI